MLGGTWLKNRYPGCECDVFAHFYSFSFSLVSFVFLKGVLIVILQNLSWSKAYPGQKEILNYLNTVAAKFGVLSNIRFNTKVVRSVWSHQTKVWTVETGSGQTFKGDQKPDLSIAVIFHLLYLEPFNLLLVVIVQEM